MCKLLILLGVGLIVGVFVTKADDLEYSDESVESTTVDNRWQGTINRTCSSYYDCDQRQACVQVGNATDPGASVCRCVDDFEYDHYYQFCIRQYLCYDYCDLANGYECIMNECRWSYKPVVPNDYSNQNRNPVPMFAIFGLFSLSVLIVLLVWKCTVQRRLAILFEASRAAANQRTAASLFSSSEASNAQEPQQLHQQRDDPPKYSTLNAPWSSTDVHVENECQRPPPTCSSAATAPPLSTLSLSVSEAERLTSRAPFDAPPPYSEISSGPANQRASSNW